MTNTDPIADMPHDETEVLSTLPKPKKNTVLPIVFLIILTAAIATLWYIHRGNSVGDSGQSAMSLRPYTYLDNQLAFSYPATWYPHEKHGRVFLLKKPNTPDIENTEIYAYGDQITISDYNLTDKEGNRLTRAQYDAYIVKNPPAAKDEQGHPIIRTAVTVNNIPMTRIDSREYAGDFRTLRYEILHDDLIYEIRLYPYDPDSTGDATDRQNIADLEAVVKTVHFLK
jgi:hypothetical protein